MKAVDKYLAHHSEPEVEALGSFPDQLRFQHSIVVPAYRESAQFINVFTAKFTAEHLMIVVVNQPDTDDDTTAQQTLVEHMSKNNDCVWKQENLTLYSNPQSGRCVLLVDRFTVPIPSKLGVGLARKIGCDIATWLITRGHITSPWIASSDADCELPRDYFNAFAHATEGACIFDYQHLGDTDDVTLATLLYQEALHYFVEGLRWAGSPYAFHTLGSVLAVHYHSYCQVRGFPLKNAAEDFYLLNKVAKIAPISSLKPQVKIYARKSDRVPMGTGPSVDKILQLKNPVHDYQYYQPQVFSELKALLIVLKNIGKQRENEDILLSQLSSISHEILLDFGFKEFLNKQKTQKQTEKQWLLQINNWFDGFRTRKFINCLTQKGMPNIPLVNAIQQCEFYQASPKLAELWGFQR